MDVVLDEELDRILETKNETSDSSDFFEAKGEDRKYFDDFHDEQFFNKEPGDSESCKRILYQTLSHSNPTRVWDVLILIPNICFLTFLALRMRNSLRKLANSNAPMMSAFHHLVFICSIVGVARCIVSIIGSNVASDWNESLDKSLWIILRAFLLATEISVLAFGILTGNLDSKSSIKRVVVIASSVSVIFSSVQAVLEFALPDPAFKVGFLKANLFGHGGRVFWGISSGVFSLVYAVVLILPSMPCRHWLMLPHKRSFYYYASFLLVLNVFQTIGCGMTESRTDSVSNPGLCFVSMTTYIYFVAFAPVVYFTFLYQFFGEGGGNQPTLLFSYKAQMDEMDEDTVNIQANGSEDLYMQESNTPIIINGQLRNADSQNDS